MLQLHAAPDGAHSETTLRTINMARLRRSKKSSPTEDAARSNASTERGGYS